MPDGTTYRATLESVVRQSGGRVIPPELAQRTEAPTRALYLWNYFMELNALRGYDGFSGRPLRIPLTELEAWSRLTRTPLEGFEVDILCRLDHQFVTLRAKHAAETQKPKPAPAARKR
jgi:hypothetical protein